MGRTMDHSTVLDAAKQAQTATKGAFITSGLSLLGALTLNEWAAIVGIVATVLMTAVNWYYKHAHLKLARQLAAHGALQGDPDDDDE